MASDWDDGEELELDDDEDLEDDEQEEDPEDDDAVVPLAPVPVVPIEPQPPAATLPPPVAEHKAGDPSLAILKRNLESTVRKLLTLDNAQGKRDLFDARAAAAKDGDLVALEEAVRAFEMSEARLDTVRAVIPEMLTDKLNNLFLEVDRIVKDRRN